MSDALDPNTTEGDAVKLSSDTSSDGGSFVFTNKLSTELVCWELGTESVFVLTVGDGGRNFGILTACSDGFNNCFCN